MFAFAIVHFNLSTNQHFTYCMFVPKKIGLEKFDLKCEQSFYTFNLTNRCFDGEAENMYMISDTEKHMHYSAFQCICLTAIVKKFEFKT